MVSLLAFDIGYKHFAWTHIEPCFIPCACKQGEECKCSRRDKISGYEIIEQHACALDKNGRTPGGIALTLSKVLADIEGPEDMRVVVESQNHFKPNPLCQRIENFVIYHFVSRGFAVTARQAQTKFTGYKKMQERRDYIAAFLTPAEIKTRAYDINKQFSICMFASYISEIHDIDGAPRDILRNYCDEWAPELWDHIGDVADSWLLARAEFNKYLNGKI